jgi:hypothetical protein
MMIRSRRGCAADPNRSLSKLIAFILSSTVARGCCLLQRGPRPGVPVSEFHWNHPATPARRIAGRTR